MITPINGWLAALAATAGSLWTGYGRAWLMCGLLARVHKGIDSAKVRHLAEVSAKRVSVSA
jgi:hypothetical protein